MSMRVSLVPVRVPRQMPTPLHEQPTPLLDPGGARVILGGQFEAAPAAPIVPGPATLFGPRGAVLSGKKGPLVVCDTGHHRLMIWSKAPGADGSPADLVIGQPQFGSEGRNAGGEADSATLNVPTGVAFEDGILAVADAWNHRVLLWRGMPTRSNQPADIVVGQLDFTSTRANRGADTPDADTLNWCYGVAIHSGRLFVADTGNRRVLVWNEIPHRSGIPADLVLGQLDFTTRDEGGVGDAKVGMRWPHAISAVDDMLFVADAGYSRVMVWHRLPRANGFPCDLVLGQRDFTAGDHNAGEYHPTAAAMNMPYGICPLGGQLVVADTANSRLLGFCLDALTNGRAAARLSGQPTFEDKGDNRWTKPARDSLCWPYALAACGSTVVVADSGNNRVLLWEAA